MLFQLTSIDYSFTDGPKVSSWMANTTVIHQPATESTRRTPISEMGDTWLDSQEDILKGARGLTFGRNGSEEEGSAQVRERLEAHGGPRSREYIMCLTCMQ